MIPLSAKKFCSPLRNDKKPGCNWYKPNDILYLTDWAEGKNYNCFELVMEMKGCDYHTALHTIYNDLIKGKETLPDTQKITRYKKRSSKCKIRVRRVPWNINNYAYWKEYDIQLNVLRYFNISPIDALWINDKLIYPQLAYCYHYFNYDYTILQPYSDYKWMKNHFHYPGLFQLKNKSKLSKDLVITKSLKDVAVLIEHGIDSFGVPAEGYTTDELTMEWAQSKYKNIYTLFDNDMTGKKCTIRHRNLYNTIPLLLDECKDISEFQKLYSHNETTDLINATRSKLLSAHP